MIERLCAGGTGWRGGGSRRAAWFAATREFTESAGITVVAGRPFLPEEEAEGRDVVLVLALVLAILGVYGVVSYSVAQRGHEIGIRVAVGASRGDVLRLVLGDGLRLAAQAVAVGLVGAFLLTRSLERLLYGVGALDPLTLAGSGLVLLLATLAASGGPAWRGTRVDPVVALRDE